MIIGITHVEGRESCVKIKLEVDLFHAIKFLYKRDQPFVIPFGDQNFINYLYVTFGDK